MSQHTRVALIAGVTGIVGWSLARRLVEQGSWKVYGISRRPPTTLPSKVIHVRCDLLDADNCKEMLSPLNDVSHVFFTTWTDDCGDKNAQANETMIVNLLDNLVCQLEHVAVLTGAKQYMGLFGEFGPNSNPTPYKESLPRLDVDNFYHRLEDVTVDRAKQRGFTWSVARPTYIIGFGERTVINLALDIAVYATICKHLDLPFVFHGTKFLYNCLHDCTDSEILAEHLIWEATTPGAANQAFNVTNGDFFRFSSMWKTIADYFGIDAVEHEGEVIDLGEFMKDKSSTWDCIVKQYGLRANKLEDLCCWMYTKLDFEFEYMLDMNKSRELGFLKYQNSEKAFIKAFNYLRKYKVIP